MEPTVTTTYSAAHAIDTLGFGKFQILLSLAMGAANLADAMEMMILSILAPALHCHWGISQVEQATITTVVFLGMLISAVFWGMVADRYGRRPTLIMTSFFLCYFGFLTSFAPNFGWVVFIRFLVGFFIGGIPQSCTLYAEFLPTAVRGRAIMVMSFFWAFGACLESLLAWLIMPVYGWRYLVGISVIPLLIFLIFSPIVPESLLFLVVSGQKREAEKLVARIARINGKEPPVGHLELAADEASKAANAGRGRVQDLLRVDRRILTLMVWFLWFVAACTYYGVVLFSTELLNSNNSVCKAAATTGGANVTKILSVESGCSLHTCQGLSSTDYVELIWTTFAEFPGTIVAIFLIDWLGRKKTLAICAASFSISTLVVMECSYSKTLLVIMLFIARGMSSAFFQAVYVYTPEVYPTNLRAVALGSGSACARVGAMITPYIAQVLLKKSLYGAVTVYAVIGFLAAIVSLFLPVETAGISLAETGNLYRHKELVNDPDDDDESPSPSHHKQKYVSLKIIRDDLKNM